MQTHSTRNVQKCHLSQTNQGTLASSEFVQSQGKTSFPGGSDGKAYACSAGDLGSIPGLGRSPEEGNGYPLQYSGLENSMDCIVHGGHKKLDATEQSSLSLQSKTKGYNLAGPFSDGSIRTARI